jgi:hypothetical protein
VPVDGQPHRIHAPWVVLFLAMKVARNTCTAQIIQSAALVRNYSALRTRNNGNNVKRTSTSGDKFHATSALNISGQQLNAREIPTLEPQPIRCMSRLGGMLNSF